MQDTKLKILLNGEKMLDGDAQSMRIIFRCLSGENFMTHQDYLDYIAGIQQQYPRNLTGEIALQTMNGDLICAEQIGAYFDNVDKIAKRERQFAYRRHEILYRSAMAEFDRRKMLPIKAPEHSVGANQRKDDALAGLDEKRASGEIDEHEFQVLISQVETNFEMDLMIDDIKQSRQSLTRWRMDELGTEGIKFEAPSKPVLRFNCRGKYNAVITYQGGSVAEYSTELLNHLIDTSPSVTYEEYMVLQDVDRYICDTRAAIAEKEALGDKPVSLRALRF